MLLHVPVCELGKDLNNTQIPGNKITVHLTALTKFLALVSITLPQSMTNVLLSEMCASKTRHNRMYKPAGLF